MFGSWNSIKRSVPWMRNSKHTDTHLRVSGGRNVEIRRGERTSLLSKVHQITQKDIANRRETKIKREA